MAFGSLPWSLKPLADYRAGAGRPPKKSLKTWSFTRMFEPCIMLLARADGSRVDTAFKQQPLNAADPFSTGRQVAWSGSDGISAGIVEAGASLDIENFPHTEVIVVHAGHVTLKTRERTLELAVGASAVIGRGTALRIEAKTGTRWVFCAMATKAATPGLTPLEIGRAHV